MTDVTEDELYVLALGKLNHLEEFESLDTFKRVMKLAQQSGNTDDPISTRVSTSFQFNGDFETVVADLVDKDLISVSNGEYKLSEEGLHIWRHNSDVVSTDEFRTLSLSKSLYNV